LNRPHPKAAINDAGCHADPELISIVVPAFNEAGNIRSLYSEVTETLSASKTPWEIIFVDDGSTDSTWEIITGLQRDNGRVRGVRLSRNFGHQSALIAGLRHARGEVVISMDADLQHTPAVIPRLVDEWRRGSKVVNTICLPPQDATLFKRMTSRAFYAIFSWLGGVKLQSGMADFRLLDRQVLNDILQFQEDPLFLRGVVQWVGYPRSNITFRGRSRLSGSTKYTFRRMLKLAWQGVSSFSLVPLRIGVITGLSASFLALCSVIYAIYSKVISGSAIPGWASTVAILSFLFGILFAYLGLLGEYIGRVIVEVRGRPRYLVSELAGIDSHSSIREVANVSNSPVQSRVSEQPRTSEE